MPPAAFQELLADTARSHGWTLLPKLKLQVKGKNIFPDGTLRDFFKLHRGFWEVKDNHDDLDVEISKKIEKGYPLNDTIGGHYEEIAGPKRLADIRLPEPLEWDTSSRFLLPMSNRRATIACPLM